MKFNKKEGLSEDASVPLRRESEIITRSRGRGSQDSMEMTLVEMPNSGEMEPKETTSSR